jgi:putative tricarboxylic transport membrane protein
MVKMNRFNNDQVSAGIWFSIGLIIVMVSLGYGLDSLSSPGTGFMPFLCGMAICISSLIGVVRATYENVKGVGWRPILQGTLWSKSLSVLIALYAYALSLKYIGFLLCTFLFIGFLSRIVKPQKWPIVILLSIFVTFASYVLFEVFLKAQLPKGFFGF